MTDPSIHYTLGRLDVLVEREAGVGWLVIVNREASPRFTSALAIARCTSRKMAQELAHLVIGIETTRGGMEERAGMAIWPDGRTGNRDASGDCRSCERTDAPSAGSGAGSEPRGAGSGPALENGTTWVCQACEESLDARRDTDQITERAWADLVTRFRFDHRHCNRSAT